MHRRQTLAAFLAVAAFAAGTCSATAGAQEQRRGGSAEELWQEYPLDPEREPPRQSAPRTEARPDPRTETRPEPRTDTRPESRDGSPVTPGAGDEFESEARAPEAPRTPLAIVIVVALAVPGIALALLALEFRGRGRPDARRADTARLRQRARAGARVALARSAASDAPAPPARAEAAATDAKAPAAAAHAAAPGGFEPVPPAPPASTAASPVGGSAGPGAAQPLERGLSAASPPDPGRPWTAEINWGDDAGVWSFTIVASSDDEDARALAMSAPVQWPPASPAAVQSLIDTVDGLAASMTAAGWTLLPPGEAWYARRFAWDPIADAPPADAPGDATTSRGVPEPSAQGARTAVTR